MKRGSGLIIAIIIIAVILIGAFAYYRYSPSYYPAQSQTPASNGTSAQTPAQVPAQAATNQAASSNPPPATGTATPASNAVTISNFAFNPSTLTIKAGDTVTWTNNDPVQHTITSDTGSELSASPISNGQTYSHKFSTAGTYAYHCSIHTSMKGTIIVQ